MLVGHWWTCLGLVSVGLAQTLAAPGASPPPATQWETERIELRDGRRWEGLIESEDDAWLYLIQIEQSPGRPMYLVIRPISRPLIRSITRLKPEARARLQRQIEQFRNRAQIEAGAMDAVALQTVVKEGSRRLAYQGKWFVLESTVDEEITRRFIVRMEQVFTAYRQVLPPRAAPRSRLSVLVFGSPEEYRTCLKKLHLSIANPAVFLREPNLVVSSTDIAPFAAQRDEISVHHRKLQAELRQLRDQLGERLKKLRDALRDQRVGDDQIRSLLVGEKRKADAQIKQIEQQVKRVERDNEKICDRITAQALTRLYHESFHAYLDNYVCPRDKSHVPSWLDEGLAMIFEEASPESGTLRLGAPHRGMLRRLTADLAARQPLTVEQVVAAGQQDFVIAPGGSTEDAQRYYWYAWGLAYYLTFEKHLLTDPAFDRYVADAKPSPVQRFEQLVGVPLGRFEVVWEKYIKALK
jgi:hypothetical protein